MAPLPIALLATLVFAAANVSAASAQMPNFKGLQDKLKETPDSSKDIQAQSRRPADVPKASGDSRRSTQAESSPESSWEKDLCALITQSGQVV
ncbi:MAG TPA: hypothetical protein VJX71_28780 [Methylomirabilota bacterium]|nr:hypothetical protein [Methylomirabilota bacterium]